MDENRKYKDKAILEEIKKVIEKRENDTDIEMHIEIKDEGAVIEVVKSSNKKLKEENICECNEKCKNKNSAEDFLTFLEKILTRG